jgi:hypothetical protein
MRKSFRTVALVVVLFCWGLSGGVAAADPPNLEDVTDQFKDTPDGWRLHVSLYNMTITSVPNMAATAFSREAFVSATAEVWVEALHPEERTPEGSKVTQRSISLWLQQGCQANLSTTTLSDNGTSGGGLSATTGTDATGASTGTATSPNVTGNNNPSIQQTLQPGTIARKTLQNKAYPDLKFDKDALQKPPEPPPWVGPGWSNDKLTVAVHNWDLKVDSCAGPVSFRFIAGATMSTLRSEDNVDAFSAIVQV